MANGKKKVISEILEKMQKGEGAIFETSKGLQAGEAINPRKVIRDLRKQGIEAVPLGGSYKGEKNLSVYVPDYSNEDVKKIVHNIAQKTGQESILVTEKAGGGKLIDASGKEMMNLPGQTISARQPNSEAYTKIMTKNGPVYIEFGTGKKQAVHLSPKEGLTEISPKFAGSNVDAGRNFKLGKPSTQTSFGYADIAGRPEEIVSSGSPNKYVFNYDPSSTYDLSADPSSIIKKSQEAISSGKGLGGARDQSDFIRKSIKDEGHSGLLWKQDESTPVVEIFNPTEAIRSLRQSGANSGVASKIASSIGSRATRSAADQIDLFGPVKDAFESSPVQSAIEGAKQAYDAYDQYYQKPMADIADKISKGIVDTISFRNLKGGITGKNFTAENPFKLEGQPKSVQEVHNETLDGIAGAISMGLQFAAPDPLMGAGDALKAAKSLRIAPKVIKEAAALSKADEAAMTAKKVAEAASNWGKEYKGPRLEVGSSIKNRGSQNNLLMITDKSKAEKARDIINKLQASGGIARTPESEALVAAARAKLAGKK